MTTDNDIFKEHEIALTDVRLDLGRASGQYVTTWHGRVCMPMDRIREELSSYLRTQGRVGDRWKLEVRLSRLPIEETP